MCSGNDNNSSGILSAVSRQAGAVAGTSVVISKKIADHSVKTMTGAKDCLKQPLKYLVPARGKKSSAASQTSAIKSRSEQETGRKKAAKALIAAFESDLATAKHELKKAQSNAEKTQSKLASQLEELKVEKESLLSDLEQAKSQASEAVAREDEVKTGVTALESDLAVTQRQLNKLCKVEEDAKFQPPPDLSTVGIEEFEIPEKAKEKLSITEKQIQKAVFPKATDKIIFSRALSDITSQDAAVRADAVKIMAGIRHKLSIKALSAQIACDTSARVRQECTKALTVLEMKEGLSAIERALEDRESSVRLAAVWGLYRLAGVEGAPALLRMFTDEDEEVRRRAATCIGWLGQEKLAVELLPLLDDNSISVRRAAVEAMANLRSQQVVSFLIERLNDPVVSIRKAVLNTIETITGKKMSKSFPKGEKEFARLIMRWRQWRKEELLG
jgi:HEAT repeat protein